MKLNTYLQFSKGFVALAGMSLTGFLVTLPAHAGMETSESSTPAETDTSTSDADTVTPGMWEPTNEPTSVESSDTSVTQLNDSTSTEAPDMAATPSASIVDVAAQNGSFSILTSAIEAAGLTEVLQGEGPYTVFAPTDEAFAALPAGALEALLRPENRDLLVQLLTYHVVPGTVTSDALTSGEVTTVEGSPVTIQVAPDAVQVNDAAVIQPDVMASNGVIHAIDRVILPPAASMEEMPESASPESTPDITPEMAPRSTPEMAPRSTPEMAPESTPDMTP